MLFLPLLLFNYRTSTAFSIPAGLSISTRDVAITKPLFNAKITDHDGMDITNNFQVLVYQEPQRLKTSNFSERQVGQSRIMNICYPSETFISSHCRFKSGHHGSLQAYEIVCRRSTPPWERRNSYSTIVHRAAYCRLDEICVTSTSQTNLIGHENVTVATAFCVAQSEFRDWTKPGRTSQHPGIAAAWAALTHLTGTRTITVVSGPDRQTPTEVDRLEIDAGNSGAETQRKQCRDCLNLQTEELGRGTDSLRVEATLLSAGATVGILWLAVMSG